MESMVQKKTILIVDDAELNRCVLADILQEDYHIVEASNGKEAIEILKKNDASISLILLDLLMPEMTGFDVLAIMQKNHWHETIPVVIISSENSAEYIEKSYEFGVVDYISRPFDPIIVTQRVKNTIILYSKQKELESLVKEQVIEKESNNALMINILSTIVEFRNGESGLHVIRIRIITEILMEALRKRYQEYDMAESHIALISNAAALHDIGKIEIPEEILNKPGKLTKEEFEIMKTHSALGAGMLDNLRFGNDEELVKYARQICRWHHERWDGNGYPDHLKEDEIPIAAQIVSLADVYDALVSERVYKPAYSHEKAIEMILNGECGMFNPKLIECLKEVSDHLDEAVRLRSKDPGHLFNVNQLSQELVQKKGVKLSDKTLFLLEQERTKYQFLTSISDEVLFEYDFNTDAVTFSDRCQAEFSIPTIITDFLKYENLQGKLDQQAFEKLKEHVFNSSPESPTFQMKLLLTKADGAKEWYEIIGRTLWAVDSQNSQLYSCVGRISNIHRQTMEGKRLETLAQKDSLTNLYNQFSAKKLITQTLEGSQDSPGVMILFDLDNFRALNEQNGHLFGDQILKHVARLTENNIRRMDIAARVGGNTFLIYLREIASEEITMMYCRMLSVALKQCYQGLEYTISIGASVFPQNGPTYEELFTHASEALHTSKHNGKNCFTLYHPDGSMRYAFQGAAPE
ncbi:diguanylate cyclase [Faecalicatena sp. AGMB00832]|uniref:Diguanylate cyclase n=1 Tax=Faecalicatena faecalis TaxID=2726362 RepID=A0ABS6D7L1_9FIRM|nr:diguanylate cyclase [Faecalicatena faecalis]MBU3877588.1 diguanylate cyclase [Faecalicatena faecalis]